MARLCIIGGGPAGYNAAVRARELGLDTLLIEKDELGGTCLNRGCIPTKCLLHTAELYSKVKSGNMGIEATDLSVNEDSIYERKGEIVEKIRNGIGFLMKSKGIEVIKGEAAFLDKNRVEVKTSEGDVCLDADYFLIVSGSSCTVLPIKGMEYALNSDRVLDAPVRGNRIAIIGGGVIGMELASYYSMIGRAVTVIEREKRILPPLDKDFASYLGMSLKKEGVAILCDCEVKSIEAHEGVKQVTLSNSKGLATITADEVIVCTGRRANINALGLDRIGVAYDRSIIIDSHFRTNIANIYAAGDCASDIQLAHRAEAEAVTAVENMCGANHTFDLEHTPSCVYTFPEIASVGKTTYEKGEDYHSGKVNMAANGKAHLEGNTIGFVKLIAARDGTIVGGAVMAPRATDIIGEIALAVRLGLNASDIASAIHPHPTVCESVRQAAEVIHKQL